MKIQAFIKEAGGQFFDREGNPLSTEQISEFINTAYKGLEVIFTGEGLKQEADGWYIGVDDNDPNVFHWFFTFKITPFGKKCFATGHDGERQSKRDFLRFKKELMSDPTEHFYTEVSGKPEELYTSWGWPKVPSSEVAKMLPGKQIHPIDEYHYERMIGGSLKTKIMLGWPKGIALDKAASWGFESSLLHPIDIPSWQEEP